MYITFRTAAQSAVHWPPDNRKVRVTMNADVGDGQTSKTRPMARARTIVPLVHMAAMAVARVSRAQCIACYHGLRDGDEPSSVDHVNYKCERETASR